VGGASAARIGGDHYQHLYSWYELLQLLDDRSSFEYGLVENPSAASADDVTLHPPAGSGLAPRFIQVKWHVDLRETYSGETFLERRGRSRSLLEKLFRSWQLLARDAEPEIWLVSNWSAAPDLGRYVDGRTYGLVAAFRQARSTARSTAGPADLAERWRRHLDVDRPSFDRFASALRLKLGFAATAALEESVDDRMAKFGLLTGSNARDLAVAQVSAWIQDAEAPLRITSSRLRAAISHRKLWDSEPVEDGAEVLPRYLDTVRQSHAELAPFFRGRAPAPFLDRVYVELELFSDADPTEAEGRGTRRFPIRALLDLDPEDEPWVTRRWVILGSPGVGKTTLLRHLAHTLAIERAGAKGGKARIPIFFSVSRLLQESGSLWRQLEARLAVAGSADGFATYLEKQARKGRLVVMLDGLDEIPDHQREEASERLRGLASACGPSTVLVASRPIGYGGLGETFRELQVLPLSRRDQVGFLARWSPAEEMDERRARAERLMRKVEADVGLRELAAVPLYLTLIAILFRQSIDPEQRRTRLFDQIFDLLLKGGHRLNPKTAGLLPLTSHVRQALRLLAEDLLLDDAVGDSLDGLEVRLTKPAFATVRSTLATFRPWDGNPRQFLADVAEKSSILGAHDGEDGEWRFLHKSFLEALVAEALEQRLRERGIDEILALARGLEGADMRWAEPLALLAGRIEDPDRLVEELARVNRSLGLRALSTAQGLQAETLWRILGRSDRWSDRRRVIEQVADQMDDAERAVTLLRRMAAQTTDGNDLYFIGATLERLAEKEPQLAASVATARGELLANLAEPPAADLRLPSSAHGEVPLWIRLPAGSFWMGSPDGEGYEDEHPRHQVTLSEDFWITSVPITNALFRKFDPSHTFPSREGDHPVVDVSWYAAMTFAAWLGGSLPTEAQWEYACRAGTTSARWCDEIGLPLSRVAWTLPTAAARTYPVAEKAANPFGLHDTYGNVWEWCRDGKRAYDAAPVVDPVGAVSGDEPVVRGGSAWFGSIMARSAFRSGGGTGGSTFTPPPQDRTIGFRVVRPAMLSF
jgi:formylglycine-generating enzyme required for sulfatase activity